LDSVSGTLVSRVAVGADQASSIAKAVDLIGGWERFISPGDRILLKGQFNSPDRYPASADPGFIRDVVGLLKDAGAGEITLGASSGLAWAPTSAVLRKKKVYELAGELGINLVNFDLGDWFRVDIDGRHLKSVFITRAVLEADRIIYLPHVKTHRYARFTLGLKFAVGLTEPSSRRYLHDSFLEEKVVEINLAVRPDLVIMDGRKCLVTGGPSRGRTKKAGLVLASSDLVALDVEALKVLKSFRARNRLDKPEWDLPQIAAAVRLGLGARKEGDYRLLTA
jgi:uncharacterized protein (DUF362 family)